MAGVKTGIAYSEEYSSYKYYFTWNVCGQDAKTGEKIISWKLVSDCNGSYSRFSINLNVYNELGEYIDSHGLSPWKDSFSRGEVIDSGEFTCPLDTYFIAIEGSCYINAGIGLGIAYSWQLTDEYVPSPSAITCGSAVIGEAPKITITKYDSDTSVSISYSFGSLEGTVVEGYSGTTYDGWIIPEEFYNEMTDVKYKRCTLNAVSYRNGVITGSESCTFNVSVNTEDCAPAVSATVVDSNSTTTDITQDGSVYFVRGYSNATVTVTASGSLGSSITSYSINNGGRIATTSTATFNGITSGNFVITVTDSRGISASTTIDVDLIDYRRITCTIEASPPTTDGETTITIQGTYFPGELGAASNLMLLEYRRWVSSATAPDTWTAITPTVTGNAYKVEIPFSDLDYRSSYTFEARATDLLSEATNSVIAKTTPVFSWSDSDFEFNVDTNINGTLETDGLTVEGNTTLNGTNQISGTTTIDGSVNMTSDVTMDKSLTVGANITAEGNIVGNGDLTVSNKIATSDLSVTNDSVFNGNVTIKGTLTTDSTTEPKDYIVEQGTTTTSGWSWRYRKWNSGFYECWGDAGGGIAVTSSGGSVNCNFPVTFTDYNYVANFTAYSEWHVSAKAIGAMGYLRNSNSIAVMLTPYTDSTYTSMTVYLYAYIAGQIS